MQFVEDIRNSFVASMEKKSQELIGLLNVLLEKSDKLEDVESDGIDELIKLEYIIVRVRVALVNEIANLKDILSHSDTEKSFGLTTVNKMKSRLSNITSVLTILNDLRSDIEVSQKLHYLKNSKRMFRLQD